MSDYTNLLNNRWDKYTSTGNDGIIEHILKTINIKKGIFVEFGAWDGIKNSNCRKLFEEKWEGVFIEGDIDKYRKLKNNYRNSKNIYCLNSRVGFKEEELFDNLVDPFLNNSNIDFCSIDIDGLDLEVFETFEKYLPTVICIEGGQMLPPYYGRIKKTLAKHNIQQSLQTMVNSFEEKGYKILCSYQDSFFIKKESYDKFNAELNLVKLYFNGLKSIPRRMPFIQKYTKKVGLKNKIVNEVLIKTNYKKYGWEKRKIWIHKNKKIVLKKLNELETIEKEKYSQGDKHY